MKLLLRPDSDGDREGARGPNGERERERETVGATLIYAPVKTAYPESKDLARLHQVEREPFGPFQSEDPTKEKERKRSPRHTRS